MCRLTCHLAACRHPIRYEYDHCAKAPYPDCCHGLVRYVDATVLDDQHPFCKPCYKAMEMDMTNEFRQKRLKLTAQARADGCSNIEISEMRRCLMIEHYEQLKRAKISLPMKSASAAAASSSNLSSEDSRILREAPEDVSWDELEFDEAADIRAQLKDWNWRKLDYLHKPLPIDPPTQASFGEDNYGPWLERDESGIKLRYVQAPRYGNLKAPSRR